MTIRYTIQAVAALRTDTSRNAAGFILRDADTTEPLSLAALHVTPERYASIICESIECGLITVHYAARPSRRVYAD